MLVNKKQIKQNNLSAYIKSLNDDQKIKLWIKTLLSVHSNLPEIIKSVDKIIEGYQRVSSRCNIFEQIFCCIVK
jgi:23S rRNA A1618 N6-methylase RlmF